MPRGGGKCEVLNWVGIHKETDGDALRILCSTLDITFSTLSGQAKFRGPRLGLPSALSVRCETRAGDRGALELQGCHGTIRDGNIRIRRMAVEGPEGLEGLEGLEALRAQHLPGVPGKQGDKVGETRLGI